MLGLVLVTIHGRFRERGGGTLASVNEEFVGGSAIIVATRTKMVHATLDAPFQG